MSRGTSLADRGCLTNQGPAWYRFPLAHRIQGGYTFRQIWVRRKYFGELHKEASLGLALPGVLSRVDLGVEVSSRRQNQQAIDATLGLERVTEAIARIL